MDKKIPSQIIAQRKKRIVMKISIYSICCLSVFVIFITLLTPSIEREKIITSIVDEGVLAVSIPATGKVIPLYEEIISSPVNSKILQVYHKSGDKLHPGDSILRLDLESLYADVKKNRDELRLKRLKLEQFRVETECALQEMAQQIIIDEMKLERMKVSLVNEKFLDSIGASTPDKVKQITLEYQIQSMQLKQSKEKLENQKKKAEIDIQAQELDYKTAYQNSKLLDKTLEEAAIRAPRSSILTWVNDQVGTSVNTGSQLAVVADLEHFKIEGELPDSYTDKITVGNRVETVIGGEKLEGTVNNIVPAISNGKIKFNVTLDKNNNPKLRAGLNVDLYIILSIKENRKRIDNYSFYMGPGEYELWLIQGKNAVKKKVTLGESSFDKVEVIKGIETGDSIIISDMTRYTEKNKLNIK